MIPSATPRLRRARFLAGPGVLAAAALAAGCASTAAPTDRYYRIELPQATVQPVAHAPLILLQPFTAFGIYAERYILHRDAAPGSAITQYNYQFWAEPPSVMLGDTLAQRLRAAFGEAQVHDLATHAHPDFVVTPRLRHLEQVFGEGGAGASLAIEFAVTDKSGAPRFVVSFDETAPAASASPDAFVAAVDGLAARADDALLRRLADEFAR